MPAERATPPAAVTWSALSGPRIRLAPSATACAGGRRRALRRGAGVLEHERDVVGACWRCAAMNSIASCAPLAIEVPTRASAASPLSGSSSATRTGPLPKVWPCGRAAACRPVSAGGRARRSCRKSKPRAGAGRKRQQRQAAQQGAPARRSSYVCEQSLPPTSPLALPRPIQKPGALLKARGLGLAQDCLAVRERRYFIAGTAFEAPELAPGLYVVATPIGNLRDMTLRGARNAGRGRCDLLRGHPHLGAAARAFRHHDAAQGAARAQ